MKKFIIIFFYTWFVHVHASQIFVSPRGNDEHSGSLEKPFSSFARAQQEVRRLLIAGAKNTISIFFRGGVYEMDETLEFTSLDSSSNININYTAYQNETVLFTAGRRLKPQKILPNGHWQVDLKTLDLGHWNFDQLFVNGKRAQRAKTPNHGFHYMHDVHQHITKGHEQKVATQAKQYLQIGNPLIQSIKEMPSTDLNNIVMTIYHKWDITKRYLSGISKNHLMVEGKGMKPWNDWRRGQRFVLENHLSFLDAPGEWYLSKEGILNYYPRLNENFENTTFVIPKIENFIEILGTNEHPVSNISFKGITFAHSNHQLDKQGFEANQAAAQLGAAVHLEYAYNILFERCEFKHLGKYAIWISKGCSNVELHQCLLEDLGAGGVKIGESRISNNPSEQSHHHKVHNCIIRSAGHLYPCAVGVWIGQSSYNEITHNEISDLFYSGISVGWNWNYKPNQANHNKIAYNHIHHLGYGLLSDMGGVYTLGHSPGTHVHNNIIHDIYSYTYGGWGLYTDQGSSHIRFNNNLVYHTKSGGFHQHYGKDNIIENNIFYDQIEDQLKLTRVEEHTSFIFRNNLVVYLTGNLVNDKWNTGKIEASKNLYWTPKQNPVFYNQSLKKLQSSGKEKGSIIADPQFTDAKNLDFRISDSTQISKIEFKPFELQQVGVIGNQNWIKKARERNLPSFKLGLPIAPPPIMPISDNFELDLLNQLPNGIYLSPENVKYFTISHKPNGKGQCLKIQDKPDLTPSYHPHLNYRLSNKQEQISSINLELFTLPETDIILELRHYPKNGKYLVGPKLQIRKEQLSIKNLNSTDFQSETWIQVYLDLDKMNLSLISPGSETVHLKLSSEHQDFQHANWFGITFPAKKTNHAYLDNVFIQTANIK